MRSWPAFLFPLLLCVLAQVGIRVGGDCQEYVPVARALAEHGAPDVRAEDVEWVADHEPELRRYLRPVVDGLKRGDLTPLPTLRRTPDGAYYSLHFWFYSLLCAPFMWLSEMFGFTPIRALACVNGLAASAAALGLWRHFGGVLGLAVAELYVLSGTMLYLGWTGPEVFTGTCVVFACLTARRRELAPSLFWGALAAIQNPSALFLLAYSAFWCRSGRVKGRHEAALIVSAALLTLLPYAFFYAKYRMPSVIMHFATDFSLIGSERAFSLLFDLNQGLIMGLPGLLLGTAGAVTIASVASPRTERRAIALDVGTTLLLIALMAVPTFAIHNWNSGSSVIIRYGSWLALPLLVLLGELLKLSGRRARLSVLAVAGTLQIGVLALNGVFGERSNYLRHSWAAKLVLRHLPALYNPVPEILYERSLGWEKPPDAEDIVVWPYRGTPGKLMVRAGVAPRSARICPDDEDVQSSGVHRASAGWVYMDAPFRCSAEH